MACAMAFDVVQNPAHGVWENNTTHCQNVTGNSVIRDR